MITDEASNGPARTGAVSKGLNFSYGTLDCGNLMGFVFFLFYHQDSDILMYFVYKDQ